MKAFSYDLHLHSCLSPCGSEDMTPANIAAMAAIIGLDVIALTDHNTCRNCPALVSEAEKYGLAVLCGMELCTSEEVHVLCYFPTPDKALAFDSFVYDEALPDIKNVPSYFGRQTLYDFTDKPCGELEKMLIGAAEISFSQLPGILEDFGGLMVPAHIDKASNSLISNLGFIPEDSTFHIAEFHDPANADLYIRQHPYLTKCRFLTSSDAHDLQSINEPVNFLHAAEKTPEAVFEALCRSTENI